jgi:hypothetical protein
VRVSLVVFPWKCVTLAFEHVVAEAFGEFCWLFAEAES